MLLKGISSGKGFSFVLTTHEDIIVIVLSKDVGLLANVFNFLIFKLTFDGVTSNDDHCVEMIGLILELYITSTL